MARRKKRTQAVEKHTPTNQAWSTDPSLWMQLGYPTVAGDLSISSPVEAGCSLIANDISTLPLLPYEVLEDGSSRVYRNHAAFRLLRKPNHYQTYTDFMNYMVRSVLLWGNAYAWVDRNARNEIIALYPMRPRSVEPMVAMDGSVYYTIYIDDLMRDADGNQPESMMVPAADVFHDRIQYDRHPLKGISPLYAIKGAARLNSTIVDTMADFHANAARPSGILSAPANLKPEAKERLRSTLQRQFTGQNAGRVMVLDFETKFEKMTMTANESQSTEFLKYTIEEVARALRIPHHMMGISGSGSTSSVEIGQRMYHTHCLRPHLARIETRFNAMFDFDGFDYRCQFLIDELFRAETMARVEYTTKAIQGGLMTPNEGRAKENLPPIEGGDQALVQRQMTPLTLVQDLAVAELAAKSAPPSGSPSPSQAPPPEEDDVEDEDEAEDEQLRDLSADILKELGIHVSPDDTPTIVHKSDPVAEILRLAGVRA